MRYHSLYPQFKEGTFVEFWCNSARMWRKGKIIFVLRMDEGYPVRWDVSTRDYRTGKYRTNEVARGDWLRVISKSVAKTENIGELIVTGLQELSNYHEEF